MARLQKGTGGAGGKNGCSSKGKSGSGSGGGGSSSGNEGGGSSSGNADRTPRWAISPDTTGQILYGSDRSNIPGDVRTVLRTLGNDIVRGIKEKGGADAALLQKADLGEDGITRVLGSHGDGWCYWHSGRKQAGCTPGALITRFADAIDINCRGNQRSAIIRANLAGTDPVDWCVRTVKALTPGRDIANGEYRHSGPWACSTSISPILAVLLQRRIVVITMNLWLTQSDHAILEYSGTTFANCKSLSLFRCGCAGSSTFTGRQQRKRQRLLGGGCTCAFKMSGSSAEQSSTAYTEHATAMLIKTHTHQRQCTSSADGRI